MAAGHFSPALLLINWPFFVFSPLPGNADVFSGVDAMCHPLSARLNALSSRPLPPVPPACSEGGH